MAKRKALTVVKDGKYTQDSFANFVAKLGLPTTNLQSSGTYYLSPFVSRLRVTLEAAYRSSWIVGQVVDTVAEDMTREGIDMHSDMSPDDVKKLQASLTEFAIWRELCNAIKWSRLYGGCLAIILTEGADYEKPLNPETVGKGRFKGLLVLDRWQVDPSFGDLITELGKDMGKPKYYNVLAGMPSMASMKIHHSRVIRFDGIELPYYQKLAENLWGLSVLERMYDRLIAFDSATVGASQLLHKAHLRTVQIDGLREALATGGRLESAVIKQFDYIRLLQTMEGMTVLDAKDKFEIHPYSFAGISDVLIQFGQQISGATGIPLVRLFGQSPAGLSATGESDLRNYYDHINKLQEAQMRSGIQKLLDVMSMSILGKKLPDDFEFEFNSLWQMSDQDKAQITTAITGAISQAHAEGLVTTKIAMKELVQSSRITGIFTNITDEDIENAVEQPPGHEFGGAGGAGGEGVAGMPPKGVPGQVAPGGVPQGAKPAEAQVPAGGEKPETDEGGTPSLEQLQRELDQIDVPSNDPQIEALKDQLDTIKIPALPAEPTLVDLQEKLDDLKISEPNEFDKMRLELNKINLDKPIAKKMSFRDRMTIIWDKITGRTKDKVAFEEQKHPRAKSGEHGGEFVKKGTSTGPASAKTEKKKPDLQVVEGKKPEVKADPKNPFKAERKKKGTATLGFLPAMKNKEGKFVQADGKPLPEHIQKIKIMPAWTKVLYNPDPNGDLLVQGYDAAGRPQPRYSDDHDLIAEKMKFARVHELNNKYPIITKQNETNLKKGFEKALVMKLVIETGIRPGSEKDTKAKKKAYGATTLLGQHVKPIAKGKVLLEFVGKEGIDNKWTVTDPLLVKEILRRAKEFGKNGKIFPETNGKRLCEYAHELDGGYFTPKDFRTLRGTGYAIDVMKGMPKPTTEKEYKKAVLAVALHVAEKLNNKPKTVLKYYINPSVFAEWRVVEAKKVKKEKK